MSNGSEEDADCNSDIADEGDAVDDEDVVRDSLHDDVEDNEVESVTSVAEPV